MQHFSRFFQRGSTQTHSHTQTHNRSPSPPSNLVNQLIHLQRAVNDKVKVAGRLCGTAQGSPKRRNPKTTEKKTFWSRVQQRLTVSTDSGASLATGKAQRASELSQWFGCVVKRDEVTTTEALRTGGGPRKDRILPDNLSTGG